MDKRGLIDAEAIPEEPAWLAWAIRLQALAQDGLFYASDAFDVERYGAIRQIAAEMMAAGAACPVEHVLGLYEQQAGYATPKVDVRGVVFRDSKVLMVQEHADGLWTLPGGWADPGDTPSAAVEREIREESGYHARAMRLLAVYDRAAQGHTPPHAFAIYKLFFLCELAGGEATASIETDAVGFFDVEALPPLSLARVTAAQILRFRAMAGHPDQPVDFD